MDIKRTQSTSPVKRFQLDFANNPDQHITMKYHSNAQKAIKHVDPSAWSKCFKQLVQQKMFGRVIGYDRKKFSTLNNIRYNQQYQQKKQQRVQQDIKKKQRYSLNNSPRQHKILHKQLSSKYYGQGFLTSTIQQKSNDMSKQKDRTHILNRNTEHYRSLNTEAYRSYQIGDRTQNYPKISFISAIDQNTQNPSPGIRSEFSNNKIKRSRKAKGTQDFNLSKNLLMLPDIQQNIRNSRNLKSKIQNRELIDMNIWNVISKKLVKQKTSSLLINTAMGSEKQAPSRLLDYQGYLEYMNYVCHSCQLHASFLQFFQPKGIKQGLNKKIYQKYFTSILNYNQKIWSVFIFRYFDMSHKGHIQNRDLLRRFNQLGEINESKNCLKSATQFENDFSEQVLRVIKSKRKLFKQTMINQINRLAKIILSKQKYRKNFTQQQLRDNHNKKKLQIESQETFMMQNIEESLIRKQKATVQDAAFLLGGKQDQLIAQTSRKNTSQSIKISPKKSAIESSSKNPVHVKQSCCYRQCFVATEHNQMTRQRRQKIECIKQEIKQMRLNRSENLEFISLSYQQFLNSEDGHKPQLVIRDLVLQLHGYCRNLRNKPSQLDFLSVYS